MAADSAGGNPRHRWASMENSSGSVKKRFQSVEKGLQSHPPDGRIGVMNSTAIQFWFWYFSPPDRGAGEGS
jgi:hypothetical protein